MARTNTLAALSIILAGCAAKEAPIGYTPSSPAESGRSEAPPAGGGGYEFGANLQAVRAKCAAQHGVLEHGGRVSTCTTKHAELGATQVTLLEYCSGVVCRIHSVVILDRPDAKSWLVSFEYLRRELSQRYGTPDGNETEFPAECESAFADCVRSGKARAELRWRWDDGHAVLLRIGTSDQVPASISVSYASPDASTH